MYEIIYDYMLNTLFGYTDSQFDIYLEFFKAVSHIATVTLIFLFFGLLLIFIRKIISAVWWW